MCHGCDWNYEISKYIVLALSQAHPGWLLVLLLHYLFPSVHQFSKHWFRIFSKIRILWEENPSNNLHVLNTSKEAWTPPAILTQNTSLSVWWDSNEQPMLLWCKWRIYCLLTVWMHWILKPWRNQNTENIQSPGCFRLFSKFFISALMGFLMGQGTERWWVSKGDASV